MGKCVDAAWKTVEAAPLLPRSIISFPLLPFYTSTFFSLRWFPDTRKNGFIFSSNADNFIINLMQEFLILETHVQSIIF